MLHIIITYLSSSLILLSGLFLLMLKVPDKEEWRYLKNARIFIFLNYTFLALAEICTLLYEFKHAPLTDRRALILSISFFQALLFTFTSISYIRPRYLNRKVILLHLAVIVPFSILAAISGCSGTGVGIIAVIAYILLLIWCTGLFRRQYRLGLEELEKHYDDDFSTRMRWVKLIFYGALGIGVMALGYSILDTSLMVYDLFVIVHTLFYIYTIYCMHYCLRKGHVIIEVIASRPDSPKHETPMEQPKITASGASPQDSRLNIAMQQWIDDEKYLQKDISISEIADSLQTTHEILNEWCMAHHGMLFRTWRMNLRIDKAKELLIRRPDIKIVELQEMTGFADKSHFFKQFKQTTGMTPSEFRKSCSDRLV